jgi:hypothetical protein
MSGAGGAGGPGDPNDAMSDAPARNGSSLIAAVDPSAGDPTAGDPSVGDPSERRRAGE